MTDSTPGARAHAAFMASNFFSSLNGVRALCALVVVKEHVQWRLPLPQLFEWGFLGVDMFFVISGFLIVTLLLRERDRSGAIDLRAFYVRRTLRIFPIYYLVISLLFLTAIATYGHSTKTWELYKWSFPIFLIYAQDLIPVSMGLMFHTWSLAMEEQFYLVWPTIERFFKSAWVVPLILASLALNQAFNFGFFAPTLTALYGSAEDANRAIFQITFTPILLGVLAAHGMHDKSFGPRMAGAVLGRWMPMWLLLAAVAVCQLGTELQGATRLGVHLLFCALLLSLIVNPAHVFSKLLNSRPLVFLGTISYGLYLYHTFVIQIVVKLAATRGWVLAPALLFGVVAAASTALAALSFRFFERPAMRLKHRFEPGGGHAAAGAHMS